MSNALTVTVPDGVPFIEYTREFDAPAAAVFNAHRDPDLLKQWLGPDGYEMEIAHYEFRSGGGYRYIHRDGKGGEFAFHGVFHVVRENQFVVQTFEFEAWPDVISLESMTLEDLGDGRTRLRGHSVYPTVEARDGMAQSGMEGGLSQGYNKLDKIVAGS